MNSENVSKNESYEQIKKNTVQAANQLKKNEYVSFENPDGSGIRVLFVGNSITRHGAAPQIGWYNDCGMAASSKEKDYVRTERTDDIPVIHRLTDAYDSDSLHCA